MKTFSVIEYMSGYAVRHNASGEEHWISDGVDVLYDADDNPISPGTPGFVELWEDDLNSDESNALEAYFPHLVESDRCECGAEYDKDCFGGYRCPQCDDPCPGCHDGDGPV